MKMNNLRQHILWPLNLKLISLNVGASVTLIKDEQFIRGAVNKRQILLFCTKRTQKRRRKYNGKTNGVLKCIFSHKSLNSCRTAILISNNTNYKLLLTMPDPFGRFIILKIQINEKVYLLVNIYDPNKDKDLIQFFRKLHVLFQSENLNSEENIVLGGDFNCPLNPALDKRGGIMIPKKKSN